MDYIDYRNKGVIEFNRLTDSAREFIEWVERELGVKVNFVGTGPTNEELIDMRVTNLSSATRKVSLVRASEREH